MEESIFLKHLAESDTAVRIYLLATTANLQEANELRQTVWVVLWQKRDSFDASRSFRAWALGMARVELLKWRQQQARQWARLSDETLHLLAESTEQHAEELETRYRFVSDCLANIRPAIRQVIEQKYLDGRSIQQIAQRLGRTCAAIEMALVRGRRSLRKCVERMAEEGGKAEMYG